MTHPGGRPQRTLASLPSDWKEQVAALYVEGASDAEIKHALRVSNDLFARWLKDEPEFAEAVKEGRLASEAWWARLGREGASGKADINPTTWIFNMKNRFAWRDKQEVSGPDGGPIEGKVVFEFVRPEPKS